MPLSRHRRDAMLFLAMVILALLLPGESFAWGDKAHEMINAVAVEHLPADMPAFLRKAEAQIVYEGTEPDRWRSRGTAFLKNAQDPDHFIDLELVEGMPLPAGRYPFLKLMYDKAAATHEDKYLPDRVGLEPYATMEVFDRLKIAFREYRRLGAAGEPTAPAEFNAIFYAGWLGHYVGDGANPLHTTVNYNGWVERNPRGYSTARNFHHKFETAFVNENLAASDFSAMVRSPTAQEDPFEDYVAYLRNSNKLVPELYQLDEERAFNGTGTPAGKKFVARRLAAGAQMLLDLWYTAWLDSAPASQDRHSREER